MNRGRKGVSFLNGVVRQGHIENKASEQSLEKERRGTRIYAGKGIPKRKTSL